MCVYIKYISRNSMTLNIFKMSKKEHVFKICELIDKKIKMR